VLGFVGSAVDDPQLIEMADDAIRRARALGNDHIIALILQSAGLALNRVDPKRAIDLFMQCRQVQAFGYAPVNAQTFFWCAVAHMSLREYDLAARELGPALSRVHELGQDYQRSMTLALAASLLSRSDPDLAVGLLALVERDRAEGRFTGAARDVEIQEYVRAGLEERLEPDRFASAWAEGRAMDVDDAVAATLDALDRLAETRTSTP
jgi:hypothetical protein